MAVHRGRGAARRRALVVVVITTCTLSLVGSALAEVRDRAIDAWIRETVRVRTTLASYVPRPAAPPRRDAPPPPVSAPRRAARARPVLPPPPPLEPDEILDDIRAAFCPEAARRLCDARRRCGCVYDEPDCVERLEAECSDGVFEHDGAVPLELDGAVLARCLEGFEDLGSHCELDSAIAHGCGWPVREAIELGAHCTRPDVRCRDGACDVTGTCVPLPGADEHTPNGWCALDTVVVSGTCLPAVRSGEACDDWSQCEEGRYECVANRCVPRVAHGGPCEASWECDTGLLCAGPLGERRCGRAPIWCADGQDCGAESECVPPPSACRPCADPSTCSGEIRCTDGGHCGPGLECAPSDTASGRCQPTLCRVSSLAQIFGSHLR